ncbi:MAG: prepilin peptidase [Pseudomonadota bacterium]
MPAPELLAALRWAFLLVLLAAAITDLRWLRIPNGLVLAALGLALTALVLTPAGWQGRLLAGGLVFAVTVPLFAFNLMGGGDAKLFPVLGLWLGGAAFDFFLLTSLLAAAFALLLVVVRRLVAAAGADPVRLWPVLQREEGVPLAVPALPAAWFWV